MNKITISLGGKDYDIKLEGDFAVKFESDFRERFKGRSTIDPKDLLMAYVEQCYDNFMKEQEIKNLISKINSI